MNHEEKQTVRRMIEIYCRAKHGTRSALCEDCQKVETYALTRLEKCTFGEDKPTCQKCPIHCYAPAMKEKVQHIMRYAGPRMLFRSPMLAIRHLLKNRRPVPTKAK